VNGLSPVSAAEAALITKAVDSLAGEMVEFLQRMVRIPTENPPGKNYRECAAEIGKTMSAAGLDVETIEVPDHLLSTFAPQGNGLPRPSVIGRMPGRRGRPVLHFTGHYDVVPAGAGWSVDPYGAVLKSGNVYGRGACDQKSGIAAQVFALAALRKAGLGPEGTLIASATPDEETGGFAGIGYLVDTGVISRATTDWCVITECLDVDSICLGHRGTLWLELETRGRQCHGSMPSEGVNAITRMLDLLAAVREEILPALAGESRHPVMPPACRRSTLEVTMMEAGTKVNIVPASCRATLDWRLIPEQGVGEARAMLDGVVRRMKERDPGFECVVREIMRVDPTLVASDTEVVRAFQAAGLAVRGEPMRFSVSPGSDDQKFIVQKAGLEQCIVYGPGPLAVAHKANEFQSVQDLVEGAKVMALAAWALAGRAERPSG
jgi:succinyl-diaminopimelate desuccinylase